VRVEADIEDAEFFLMAAAPSAALWRAVEETKRRIPAAPKSTRLTLPPIAAWGAW
jgi:hypothetical protein